MEQHSDESKISQSQTESITASRSQRKNKNGEKSGSSNSKRRKKKAVGRKERKLRESQRWKEDRIVSRIVTIVMVTLIVVGLIFGLSTYRYVTSSLKPLDPDNSEVVLVEIPIGSSNKMIGNILEKDQVIKSATIFNYFMKFNNLTGFQAGKYQLAPNMTLDEIGHTLQEGGISGDQADARIIVKEGFDIDKIGDAIAESTDYSKKEFLALMKDDAFFKGLVKTYPELLTDASKETGLRYHLEGYMFPATYDYYKGMSLEDIAIAMVNKSNEVMANYYDQIKNSSLNVHEVLTLASLVEKEGTTEPDRKKIAQVFLNRIAVDMPIQSDISILYALGVHKEFVYVKDLEVDSPYNLYKNVGLGPGPFDNPSEQAIKAVLNPTPNNYLYFVADLDTGNVYYAETFEEHNVYVQKYVNKED